ncbi:hypothetical protein M271_00870 [Streptomyces rapamycinicus NRRL 5491]|uniref:Uncharacterized protein n=1 Tax=Streptomyces rapamycinicus TaxID=1226757 RepID=A0ABR6LA76_9ACTN|nr:hypothetical protein M271_00870 [Streptomyces rapamycinicus NRRL 5491]MBB4779228.1 hypothetical protein [Streptomyces rapamycinicus]
MSQAVSRLRCLVQQGKLVLDGLGEPLLVVGGEEVE